MSNIFVIIVTYKNRFNLLINVINSVLKQNVIKIIIVDNGSEKESLDKIKFLEKELFDKLKVIYLNENTGSANAYKIGMKEAYNSKDCDFIWLLDDDNLPEENALSVLTDFWSTLNKKDKEINTCLVSNRDSYTNLVNIAKNNLGVEPFIGSRNSFMGFHINSLFTRIITKMFIRKKDNPNTSTISIKNYGNISLSSYGGAFFNRNLIDKIGYPNTDFFVYIDDFDYFSRLEKINGEIILLYDSKIIDLDKHEHSYNKSPASAYYIYRNTVFFQKKYNTSNKVIFFINYICYLLSLYIGLKKNTHNILIKAIKDGYNERMGKYNI